MRKIVISSREVLIAKGSKAGSGQAAKHESNKTQKKQISSFDDVANSGCLEMKEKLEQEVARYSEVQSFREAVLKKKGLSMNELKKGDFVDLFKDVGCKIEV